jgi:hypothetical protein
MGLGYGAGVNGLLFPFVSVVGDTHSGDRGANTGTQRIYTALCSQLQQAGRQAGATARQLQLQQASGSALLLQQERTHLQQDSSPKQNAK